MNIIAVALAFVAVLGIGSANVLKFEQKELEGIADFVLQYKHASLFKKLGSTRSRVTAFQWTDCGGSGAHFKSLSLSPDPLEFPGTMTIAAAAIIEKKLDSPLQANVTIEKRVGSTYIKIPCIDNFGSCVYDDLCDILDGATCPDVLTKNGINCNCPFDVKSYKLPPSQFDAESFYFPSGDYHARGEIRINGTFMGCLDFHLSIAKN